MSCYQVTCQPQTRVVKPHRRRLLSPLWPSAIESAGVSGLRHIVCTEARPTCIEVSHLLVQMQPQQLHVSSAGLYSLRKPWQLLADQLCKNLALGPGSLHLVPVGGMLYIRQEASNPNFPFRQESVGGLGPSGRARTPPLQPSLPAGHPPPPLTPSRQHRESPSTRLLLAKGEEKSRGVAPVTTARSWGRHMPWKLADAGSPRRRGQQERLLGGLLVLQSWLACTTTAPLGSSASLLPATQPEN